MESGNDYQHKTLSSDQIREIEKTRNKMQQARQDISKQLLEERSSDCEVRTYLRTYVRTYVSFNIITAQEALQYSINSLPFRRNMC